MNELIHNVISNLSDIERLTSKLATKKINPREIFSLKHSVELIENLKSDIYKTECMELNHLIDSIENCTDFISKVSNTLNLDPPASIGKGNTISSSVSGELSDLREISKKY